jgi:CheY-like chemotaxis protein
MNGWQVAEAIQEISLTRGDEKVPFVLMTGWGRSQELKPDFMQSSAVDRVLTKPLSLVDLVSTIRELKVV